MLKKTLKFIEKISLVLPGEKILVANSGGPDSMALTHILLSLHYEIGLAHVNYGFRGDESDEDERFVRTFAESRGIPFFLLRPNEAGYSFDPESAIQEQARNIRYHWFEEIRKTKGYDRIATGHHWDDQLETVLFRLARGTGLKGLTGIPVRRDRIVRPLLHAGKAEILDYLKQNGISFREDRSNQSLVYTRNKIRYEIVPILKQIFPDLKPSTHAGFNKLRRQSDLLSSFVNDFIKHTGSHSKGIWKVPKDAFIRPGYALWQEVLSRFGFSYRATSSIRNPEKLEPGQKYMNSDYTLIVGRSDFIFSPVIAESKPEKLQITAPGSYQTFWGCLELSEVPGNSTPSTDPNVLLIPKSSLRLPLLLRPREPGDRFLPEGMQGRSKTVKKFLTDIKYPIDQKLHAPVLCDAEGEILWLPGLRKAHRCSVNTPETEVFYVIKFENHHLFS